MIPRMLRTVKEGGTMLLAEADDGTILARLEKITAVGETSRPKACGTDTL